VAVIVTSPTLTPVTKPAALTVATSLSLEDQVIVRPLRAFPAASFAVAVNWSVWPTSIVSPAGLTSTLATGTGVTVTDTEPVFPSQFAVIVAPPAPTPVTKPAALTVAT
jgi:hypothetical protein